MNHVSRRFKVVTPFVIISVLVLGLWLSLRTSGALAAGTTYTWNQTGTAAWNVSTNWTPTRTTPAATDILQFNGGGTVTATSVPTETIAQLLLSNSTIVNLQSGAANNQLTMGGDTGTDLDVPSGSALNMNGANVMTIFVATGATGSISGSMTCSGAQSKLNATDASAITFNSGATFTQGATCTSNAFTNGGNPNVIVFASGSKFIQLAGANPFGVAAPNSKVNFQTGSVFSFQQNAAPSFSGRPYSDFDVNFAAFNQSGTGGGTLSMDNLTVTLGTLNLGMTGIFNLRGNIFVAGSQTLNFNAGSAATITLTNSSQQTIGGSGTLTFGANETILISNTVGVKLLRNITLGGNLKLNSNTLLDTDNFAATVNGSYTNNGQIRHVLTQTLGISGTYTDGTTIETVQLSSGTSSFGDTPVRSAAGGSNPYDNTCTSAPSNIVSRYWQITPTTSATATVKFSYRDAEKPIAGPVLIWKCEASGGAWQQVGSNYSYPAGPATGYSAVQADNVPIGSTYLLSVDTSNPAVSSVYPANGATNIDLNTAINITFTKAVTVTPTWYLITGSVSGPVASTYLPATGSATVYAVTPTSPFALGELVTVTIFAPQVVDAANPVNVMASDYSWSFTTYTITFIHTVQGSGSASPLVGNTVTVEGVVIADFQGSSQLKGFFMQEEDADIDADPTTSEGIFVYCNSCPTAVTEGQRVRVTGLVSEFNNMTELTASTAGSVVVTNAGNNLASVTAATVDLPIVGVIDTYYEAREGMLVTFVDPLSVAEYFELARYGQIVLSQGGRPVQFTETNSPNVAGYSAHIDAIDRREIILDDDNNAQEWFLPSSTPPGPADGSQYIYYPTQNGGFSKGTQGTDFFRGGDLVYTLTGVLDWSWPGFGANTWRVRPTAANPVSFTVNNPRPTVTPTVGGSIKAVGMNLLNYFTTIDTTASTSSGPCGPTATLDCRGADSVAELNRQRQRASIVICDLNADVYAFMELENTTPITTITDLLGAVNTLCGSTNPYTYVDTGGTLGTDAIRVEIIYRTNVLTPTMSPLVDMDPIHNRPPTAQTFEVIDNTNASYGERFTVIANHFKSKGCSGSETGGDLDLGDGQSCWASRRTSQAIRLMSWITSTVIPAAGDPDVLLLGDFNSYAQETPVTTLAGGGYTDLETAFLGSSAYSYLFDSELGHLDYAFANPAINSQITGVGPWHINADEVDVFDYNDEVYDSPGEATFEERPDGSSLVPARTVFDSGTPYRASDHDPVLVGLDLVTYPCYATIDGLTVYGSNDASAVQDAVDAASTNDTVKVAGYCAGTNSRGGANQTVYISKTLTIQGGYTTTDWTTSDPTNNPTILDAQSGGRVINISGVGGNVANITVQNGNISGFGGGINASSALTLTHVNVLTNTAVIGGGGAIAFGAATLNGGLFQNNTGGLGGGLYASSTLVLTDTQFLSNTAASNAGGGVLANSATNFNGATFQNNQCTGGCLSDGWLANNNLLLTQVITTSDDIQNQGLTTQSADGVILFNGTISQSINGTGSTTFSNMHVNNTGSGVYLGQNITVTNKITLTTDLTTTALYRLNLTSGATSSGSGDVWGNSYRQHTFTANTAYSFGNPNVSIAFGPTSTNPSNILIDLEHGRPVGFTFGISRAYTITITGGGPISASLRLHYQDSELGNGEANLKLWRYNGSLWVLQGSTNTDTSNNWVEQIGVSAFSPWGIANQGPTAITLDSFDVRNDSAPIGWLLLIGAIGSLIALAAWKMKRARS